MATAILGPARCTADAAADWAERRGAPAYWCELAHAYWEICWVLGVRADVAYAQGCKETNFGRFGGVIDARFHNPCGLKTAAGGGNYDPAAHAVFPDWRTGIRAHIEHLHLYADRPLEPHVDPRHFPQLAGTAPTVEALSGRWAPSPTYHESILRYVEEMQGAGMGLLTWLPDVLRGAGVDMYVLPGAETRSTRSTGLDPLGVVWHHTATSTAWLDGHVAALLRDGRRDLSGPLSQVGIERDGTWVIIACGRANHNGYGTWGNDSIGLEFYNDGQGEPFTEAQIRSGSLGTAAILRRLGKTERFVKGHKETDPGRKIDPLLSMDGVRARVAGDLRLIHQAPRIGEEEGEDDMAKWAELIRLAYEERYGVDLGGHPKGAKVAAREISKWIIDIANKPEAERHGGLNWIRQFELGLAGV